MTGGPALTPRCCILIVDDDPSVVEALRTALEGPYEVLAARTGSAALDVLARGAVDLVLLDCFLPDGSGLEILRKVRQGHPAVFVIFMTAFGSEDISVEFFRGGGHDYLKKPLKLRDLLNRTERLLARRSEGASMRPPLFLPSSLPEGAGREAQTAGLRRAIAFIDAHLGGPMTLDRLSREAGMSKFPFWRAFKHFTGFTVREFLARRRIARAAELLRDPSRSVGEVYSEFGFKDLRHFRRVFLKVTGHAPSAFRRTILSPSRPIAP